jgi:UDP-3-O-[3-hydroxymyristoyl] glucosamine N-acyltransferase
VRDLSSSHDLSWHNSRRSRHGSRWRSLRKRRLRLRPRPKQWPLRKVPSSRPPYNRDEVEIGANSTIDRGALDETRIGRGTKIDNLVHIGHNCSLGQNVVIAAQTGLSGSIVIENDVVLGGQVGIGEHARIEAGVMLGGQGGVLPNKVLRGKGVAFWGTPAQPVRQYLKQLAVLARLGNKSGNKR